MRKIGVIVLLVFIAVAVISTEVHRHRRGRTGRSPKAKGKAMQGRQLANGTPPEGDAPPANGTSAKPPANGTSAKPPANETAPAAPACAFKPFGKVGDREYQVCEQQVSEPEVHDLCKTLSGRGMVLTLDSDEETAMAMEAAKQKGYDCIWTGGKINITPTAMHVHSTGRRGNRVRIIPIGTVKGNVIPMRSPKKGLAARADGDEAGGGNGTEGESGSGAAEGPFVSISQIKYPWVETVQNETICEFLLESCTPRECTIETPPCTAASFEQDCEIVTQPNCVSVPTVGSVTNATTCNATCDECSVTQPSCIVTPNPCIIETDRVCVVAPPTCTAVTPPCKVELDECTSYQPPCKVSHPATIKDCVFEDDCYVKADKDQPLNCKKVYSPGVAAQECEGNDTCGPYIEICTIPEICSRPRLCRPPVIHCPTPEAFCPPPKITCGGPEVECTQPNISCIEPKVFCPNPTVICTQPTVNCSSPAISCPMVTTLCSNPEVRCNDIGLSCGDPKVVCEAGETCEPPDPDIVINICSKSTCEKCQCTKLVKQQGGDGGDEYVEIASDCSEKCLAVCEP